MNYSEYFDSMSRDWYRRKKPACLAGLLGLLVLAGRVEATTYYVSASTGNNSNTGLSLSSPWATISKAAGLMNKGDTCLIESGTYRETVTPTNTGTSSLPITFQADSGQTVVISGSNVVSTWGGGSGNIYSASVSLSLNSRNQVFQNGTMMPEARWPNAGSAGGAVYPFQNSSIYPSPDWTYVTSTSITAGKAVITDTSLPSRPDGYWVGATVHIMAGYGWYMQRGSVTGYTSSTSTLTTDYSEAASGAYTITPGNEFYLTGKQAEMDSNGEWFYNTGTLYYYSSTGTPTGVEYKARPYGFNLSGKSYINLIGLQFFGCTIETSSTSSYCTLNNLTMKYLGHDSNSGSADGLSLGTGFVLRNSTLSYDSASLITLAGSNIRVINNNIGYAGYIPEEDMIDINALTSNTDVPVTSNLICNNTLHDSSRAAIAGVGLAAILQYNDIYNTCLMGSDSGAMHTNGDAGGTIVRYNLFHDVRNPKNHAGSSVNGFYLDCYNENWIFHHNIIWNIDRNAIWVNGRQNSNVFFNNSCWGINGMSISSSFAWDEVVGGASGEFEASGTYIYNNLFDATAPNGSVWNEVDFENDLYANPSYVNPASRNFQLQSTSPAINAGLIITGVTDGYVGSAPDMGALESGGADWTTSCGYHVTPPSPDPTYNRPSNIFANQVVNSGFETASLSPWTTTGSVILYFGDSWTDSRVRTGYRSLQVNGTSTISQTVTGLLPSHRYEMYLGAQSGASDQTIQYGVSSFGYSTVQANAVINSAWNYNRISFITGPTSTSATIFVNVTNPDGATHPVYLDDFSVQLSQDYTDLLDQNMPLVYYTFDEGSGSNIPDHSANGNTGIISGTLTWGTGEYNDAAIFNGTNSCVSTPAFATPASFTVACWAKSPTSTWSGYESFVSKRPSFFLGPQKDTNGMRYTVCFNDGTFTGFNWTPPAGFDITQWHHYAATFTTSTAGPAPNGMTLYVDGFNVESEGDTIPVAPSTGACTTGYDSGSNSYLSASIDELRIYNYALSPENIADLMLLDTTQMFRYCFDETPNTTSAWNSSGINANAVLNGVNVGDWTTGKVVGALHFNGSSDAVCSGVTTPASFTAACWAKSDSSTWNSYEDFVSKRPSFFLGPQKGTNQMRFTVYFNNGTLTGFNWTPPAGFDITQWHHYVGTFTTSTAGPAPNGMTLYVDGVQVESRADTIPVAPDVNGTAYIGHDPATYTGTNTYLTGTLDEVRLYNTALSAYQVEELYFNVPKPPYP